MGVHQGIDRLSGVLYGDPGNLLRKHPSAPHWPAARQAVHPVAKGPIPHMAKHSHRFVENYKGFVGFGLDRSSDEKTIVYYLQKISDDTLAPILIARMTDDERLELFDLIGRLMKRHLSEDEYHRLFLKDR